MISTGDNLLCIFGNDFYVEGGVYTVGDYINSKFFEVMTGDNDECWYAKAECASDCINIRFNSINDACFEHHTCSVEIKSI
ncbi:hypothetical protein ES754_01285 [Psychrobacter frigidicola]|uniref:Uncharacterized protein n=1 Tax=Psychrobacter frigidicola TaxID=45611 RepID=A0A5C7A4W4_9GAMM|nr:hypothetical protein [Psychrobacter frigidicola]TXD97650.1 hypothetical protein ES754_01285 [Psychrobacter frigidicola]